MTSWTTGYERRRSGKVLQLTLEHEAVEILQALAPTKNTQGYLVSQLLRQEEQRRRDIRHYREEAAATQAAQREQHSEGEDVWRATGARLYVA